MPDITLGGITLPEDLQWIDEFADGSDLVGQEVRTTITGALVIQASAQQAGRKLTLQGRLEGSEGFTAVSRGLIDDLRVLAAIPAAVYAITLADGRTFDVVFRRDGGPAIEAAPLKHIAPAQADDLYFPTIRLMMV